MFEEVLQLFFLNPFPFLMKRNICNHLVTQILNGTTSLVSQIELKVSNLEVDYTCCLQKLKRHLGKKNKKPLLGNVKPKAF